MPAIKTFDSDVKIWFPTAHWILSKKSFLPRLFVNESQVYAISFPSLVYQRLWRVCAWNLISRNIFWGMPDFPNIFGVNNKCRTQAYVWGKNKSTPTPLGRLAFRMAKFSNVEIEPAGYFSKEANEPAYKCKRAANAQMHKLAQTFAISSGDKGRTWKMIQYRFDYDS